MANKTIVLLVMLCLFLAACGEQREENTVDLLDSPEVTESPSEETLPVVDYDAVPMADIASEQLSAFRAQDLHAEHVVGINSEGEITLIELTTGQESTISSDGMAVEVVLSDEFIAWTRVEEPIESKIYHIFVHDRATGEQKRITEEPAQRYYLAIDGTRLVWADKRNEMDGNYYDTDIYGYDLATDTEYAIAVAPGNQQQPSIHGDLVVWQDNRNSEQRDTVRSGCGNCPDNRFDLYLYDFKDKDDKGKPIVEDKGNNSQPQIMGNRVTWVSYRENINGDLYLLELDSREIRRITETPFFENDPVLTEDRLLWTVKQPCDTAEMGADNKEIIKPTGVYVWDFKTDQLQRLTSYKEPFAWLHQNTVMIREGCMAGWDVYTMTLESAELTQEAPQMEPTAQVEALQTEATAQVEPTPQAPQAELSPVSPNQGVKIRLENVSDLDIEQIEVRFKGHSEQFGGLAAGEISEERVVSEAYQSVYVKVMADGQEYVLEALDGEGEPPITAGSYTYALDIRNGYLLVDLMPDQSVGESSVASVIDALQAAGATVLHESIIQRENIFDELFGRTVATEELLQVNEGRVVVYVFDDVATAKEASETILPGGTSLGYTRPDGTTVQKFGEGIIRRSPSWWLFEHFIINSSDSQPTDHRRVALISNALQTDPINTRFAEASEVQIRLVNMSELDFDHVSVNFMGQEVDYGAVPSRKQSSYQSAQQAYRYAWVKVEANGETYEMTPIDYMGETPLSAGQYSYVLDIVDEELQIAYLPDDEAIVDLDLVGSDWYWASAQKADNSNLFPMVYEEHPSIRFTQDSDANAPGLHFEGYASCNWMGGAYHVNQYHTLVVDEIGMTQVGCKNSDSETFFLDFLRGINYYRVEGDYLFLFSWMDGMMTFTRQQPTSEPPYATDSYAALAPIVQAIASHARDLDVTRVTPSSDVQWMIDFFGEKVNVYVFDDAMMAEERAKSRFSSDNSERLWLTERFLISYDGEYDLIDDVLNDLFGEPSSKSPLEEEESPLEKEEGESERAAPISALDELEPIASAPKITFESWSPDSHFLTYRAHSESDLQQNPQVPPGAFRTWRTEFPEMRCTEMVDYNQRRPYVWIDTPGNNIELLFVTDRDEVVIWPACSDERASQTTLFPELPQAFLARGNNGEEFFFAGETSYWLRNMFAPRPIRGIEVMPFRGASWSPDGKYVALSQVNNDDEGTTYLIDRERAEVVQTISWLSPGGKGGPPGPDWLSESEFLIHSTRDRGPLLVTVDGEITDVAPDIFGVAHQNEPFTWVAYGTRDEASGTYHIALAARGEEASFPSVRLYRSESGEVEDLPFKHVGSPVFSPDGQWITLQNPVEIEDGAGATWGTYETWLRKVHPIGSQPILAVSGDYNNLAWSPDFTQVAATSDDRLVLISIPDGTIKQEWHLDRPTSLPWERAWSPNGKWLVVQQPATPDGEDERLFLIPVEP